MSATEHAPTPSEYISHHLGHLANSHDQQTALVDMSYINYDTIIWSVFCGLLAIILMFLASRKATSGVPGRFQCAVEMVVEMVNDQAKSIVHGNVSFIAPMALTVFVWVSLMNSMDFLPVDLIPKVWDAIAGGGEHHTYMRVVPTADLSVTLGMSVSVLLICIFYNIKIKGFGHWMHELFSAPFGAKLGPINFLFQMIEFIAKTVSHGMRLFGNMYAGELVFMLIALMGSALAASASGIMLPIAHIIAGSVWSIFHILIVGLQAFVFMMLTLVYVGQAHDAH